MLNSKTFKHQVSFQGLSRDLKNGKNFQEFSSTFKKQQAPCQGICRVLACPTRMLGIRISGDPRIETETGKRGFTGKMAVKMAGTCCGPLPARWPRQLWSPKHSAASLDKRPQLQAGRCKCMKIKESPLEPFTGRTRILIKENGLARAAYCWPAQARIIILSKSKKPTTVTDEVFKKKRVAY